MLYRSSRVLWGHARLAAMCPSVALTASVRISTPSRGCPCSKLCWAVWKYPVTVSMTALLQASSMRAFQVSLSCSRTPAVVALTTAFMASLMGVRLSPVGHAARNFLVVSLLGGAAAPKCWPFGGLPGRRLPRPSPFSWAYRCSGRSSWFDVISRRFRGQASRRFLGVSCQLISARFGGTVWQWPSTGYPCRNWLKLSGILIFVQSRWARLFSVLPWRCPGGLPDCFLEAVLHDVGLFQVLRVRAAGGRLRPTVPSWALHRRH